MSGREERRRCLLVDRATEGLGAEHQKELEGLLLGVSEGEATAYDLAAAAIELAYTAEERLPRMLEQRLAARWREFCEVG